MVSKPSILVSLDKERHLRLDPNAVADAEKILGMGLVGLMQQNMSGINFIRTFLWAGLKHEDRSLTQEKVGDIIFEYCASGKGGLDELGQMVADGLAGAGWLKKPEVGQGTDQGN